MQSNGYTQRDIQNILHQIQDFCLCCFFCEIWQRRNRFSYIVAFAGEGGQQIPIFDVWKTTRTEIKGVVRCCSEMNIWHIFEKNPWAVRYSFVCDLYSKIRNVAVKIAKDCEMKRYKYRNDKLLFDKSFAILIHVLINCRPFFVAISPVKLGRPDRKN